MVRPLLALTAVLGLAGWTPAPAAFMVSIGSKSIPVGGSDVIDVLIEGQAGDQLDSFNVVFTITRTSGAGFLEFSNPAATNALYSPDYVFASVGQPGPPLGATPAPPGPYDTYTVSDLVVIPPIEVFVPRILARLPVTTFGPSSPGDTFDIILVTPTSSTSVFSDDLGDYIYTPLGGTTGTVTVFAPAVPEPMSAMAFLAAAGGVLVGRGVRRSGRTRSC